VLDLKVRHVSFLSLQGALAFPGEHASSLDHVATSERYLSNSAHLAWKAGMIFL
jgi:hypothetical protein